MDELAVVLLEHVELGGLVDHAEQLLLARERLVRGRPGVTRLPIATSAAASGPSSTRVACTGNAANSISPRACARPTERGLEPTSTNETPVMISAAISSTHHHWSMTR